MQASTRILQLGISQYQAIIEINRSSLHQVLLLGNSLRLDCATIHSCRLLDTTSISSLFAHGILLDTPRLVVQEQQHCLSTVLQLRYPDLVLTRPQTSYTKRILRLISHFLVSRPNVSIQTAWTRILPCRRSNTSGQCEGRAPQTPESRPDEIMIDRDDSSF